jgi:hypothetical protein
MKQKIIMITTASLEEDFAEGKSMYPADLRRAIERHGEANVDDFLVDGNVCFSTDVESIVKMELNHIVGSDFSEYIHNLPIARAEDDYIILESSIGTGEENKITCRKIKICRF